MAQLTKKVSSFLGPPCLIIFEFADKDQRKKINTKRGSETQELYLFHAKDNVKGSIAINVNPGKKIEHTGVKLELVGIIDLQDRGSTTDFTSTVRELAPTGTIAGDNKFQFEFTNVENQFETYIGPKVRLRYVLRVSITRNYSTTIREEIELLVWNYEEEPETKIPVKMEVGIEECLHIEFEFHKKHYNLQDVVIGRINFRLVRLKIKHMEIALLRKETSGAEPNAVVETETVTKFEIMDGAPVRGETIPIRFYLKAYDTLTPTYVNVNNKFSVKYYINIVLLDEEDRRYFKQQEIILYRKKD